MEPEVEVVAQAKPRRFTVAYKRRILEKAGGCKKPGEIGALLRRLVFCTLRSASLTTFGGCYVYAMVPVGCENTMGSCQV